MTETRAVGIYPSLETYPPDALLAKNNIVHLEHVNGDQSVTKLDITVSDARKLMQWLVEHLP